jgi:hypothetical protein
MRSWGSSVSIVTMLQIFLFAAVSRPAMGPTQPPIEWVLGVERLGREADHSVLSSARVNNV